MSSSLLKFEDNSEALSISLKKENASSYGGIYSTLDDDKSNEDSDSNKGKKKVKKNIQPITFKWEKEEKESVYLTGSFCNWKQFFLMPKIDNIYTVTLPLPKNLYKFKFRINDIFMINQNYPIMKEGESDCNFIDNSQSSPTISKKGKKNSEDNSDNDNNDNDDDNEEDNDDNDDKSSKITSSIISDSKSDFSDSKSGDKKFIKKIKKRIEKMKNIKYSRKYPKRKNLNNNAPSVPYSYNYNYNIDIISSQKTIGKKKYYEPKENNILGDNCSYKKIEVLPSVEINHIHSNNSNISDQIVSCSSLTRYRNKFVTFLYYKPVQYI